MTQCEKIIQYMHDFGSITTLEAFNDLGVMRLASRIHDLKEAGYDIKRQDVKARNRYGEIVHYMRYSLADKKGA